MGEDTETSSHMDVVNSSREGASACLYFSGAIQGGGRNRATQPSRKTRLGLEVLEDRVTPAAYVVNDLGDSATPPAGTVTLRSAIAAVNTSALGAANSITFSNMGMSLTGTIALGSEIAINRDVAINGPGAMTLGVSGGGGCRVFNISAASTTSISGLLIEHGNTGGDGGGVLNNGRLTLTSDTLYDNEAVNGGGVSATSTSLSTTLDTVTVYANTATFFGGGVLCAGTMTITDSLIHYNYADESGGGIANTTGTLDLTSTDIMNNEARTSGGGIYNLSDLFWDGGQLYENIGTTSGGGLYNYTSGSITLQNLSIQDNTVGSGEGGGIFINTGTVFLDTCTMTGNSAPTGSGAGVAYHLTVADFIPSSCTLNDAVDIV